MKRILSLVFVLVSLFCYADSVQQGCVKTRGRMINGKHVPGEGLPGSIVSIKDRTAIGVKNSNGTFSFPVTDNHFRVDSVKKKDYVLLDADVASKTYTHTADTLFFVMETPEQLWEDRYSAERRFRDELSIKLKAREREVDSLLKVNAISQEEYRQSIQKIHDEYDSNDKLVRDMAERYSKLDYDQMDEFYRQVSYYIEQCEFTKADSLLKSRGNLDEQIALHIQNGEVIKQKEKELQRAKKVYEYEKDELAKRCYSYFENFALQYLNDSAAHYLEKLVNMDTTNTIWRARYAHFLAATLSQYDKALRHYRLASEMCKEDNEIKSQILAGMGMVYATLGDNTKCLELCNKALKIYENNITVTDSVAMANLYSEKGQILMEEDSDSALHFLQKALNICERHRSVDLAYIYANIGGCYIFKNDYNSAMSNLEKSITILSDFLPEDHPDFSCIYMSIGTIYYYQGKHTLAKDFYARARICDSVISPSPATALIWSSLGEVYRKFKDYKKALDSYEKALEIYKNIYGLNHLKVAEIYNVIGTTYFTQENYVRAEEYVRLSLNIKENILELNHLDFAISYYNLGMIFENTKNYEQSLYFYEKALKIREEYFDLDHDDVFKLYSALERIYRYYEEQGDNLNRIDYFNVWAMKSLGQSLANIKHVYGENSAEILKTYLEISKCYVNQGNYIAALKYLDKSLKISCDSTERNRIKEDIKKYKKLL